MTFGKPPCRRLVAVAIGLLAAAPAAATQVFAVGLEQMAAESDVVVRARAGAQQVTWDKDRRRVLTLTTIEVIEAVKGARRGELLTIYQVGGTLDGITFRIPGALQFAPGEQFILFAKRFEDKVVSYGMGLGKYALVERDGRLFVEPSYGDVAFVKRTADGALVPDAPPDLSARPLADFMRRLRAISDRRGPR
ncbi:MAG: hypothetical protein JXR83_12020 [Deltaproteobacteria bacterium]|nr:hypothetical protein [Deltaproteobacteria bacterium]